jgi:hypothetical protein
VETRTTSTGALAACLQLLQRLADYWRLRRQKPVQLKRVCRVFHLNLQQLR